MNHQKVYESIIYKAKSENRIKLRKNQESYVYYDNHHIIPACLNGSDKQFNRQLLTDKEHYVCHKLLTYIYKGNRKLACAFHRMTFGKNGKHNKSARDYAYAKELMRTIPISKETKEKLSKVSKGKPSKKRGIPISTEQKKKLSIAGKNRKHSIETRKKMSVSQFGKKLSKEHKEKISKAKIGKPGNKHTKEFKIKLSENNKKYKTGIKASKETKDKMSNTRKGVKKSEEHTRKILEGRKKYFEKLKEEKLIM